VIDWVDSLEKFPIFSVFTELQPIIVKNMQTIKNKSSGENIKLTEQLFVANNQSFNVTDLDEISIRTFSDV